MRTGLEQVPNQGSSRFLTWKRIDVRYGVVESCKEDDDDDDVVFIGVRSISGHKAAVCSLDFHRYGDILASGSMDTNLKVCIFFLPSLPP